MRNWLARLLGRPTDDQFAEEVRSHLAHEIDEQVDRGLPPEEARYAALRRFGNVTRHVERFREASPAFWLETLWQDVRYGWRSLTRSRTLFLASVVSLAVGIGGSTALFSVLYATVLDPFTYASSERLVVFVEQNSPGRQSTTTAINSRDLPEYASLTDVFSGVSGIVWSMSVVNEADESTGTANITCNFFDVAGVQATFGRTPTQEDCSASTPGVIVLSHDLWSNRFGADPNVIGRTVDLRLFQGQPGGRDRQRLTIIGVMPPRVSFNREEAWIPSKVGPGSGDQVFFILARLRTGVRPEQAAAQVATVSTRLAERQRVNSARTASGLESLREHTVHDYQATVYALLAGVGCILMIGGINVTMLLLARSSARQAELGLRVCLGAGAGRLVRQFGTESLLLAACGGIVGIGLAAAALPAVSDFILSTGVASQAHIRLNLAAVAVAAGIVLLAASTFGLVSAVHALRLNPARALAGGSRTTAPSYRSRWRTLIVATQIAIAFPVFCVTLALGQSFVQLRAAAANYGPDHLLLVMPRALGLETERYKSSTERDRLWGELDAAIQGVPGVLSTATTAPLALNRAAAAIVESVSAPDAAPWQSQLRCASPDFFSTMKIGVVRGRTFDSAGAIARQRVAVVSRSFARAYFGGTDPIGHRLRVTKAPAVCPAGEEPLEIVGIVENTQLPDLQTGNPEAPPTVYVSTEVATPRFAQFLVRTSVPAATIRRDVQRALATVDPELVGRARSLQEDVEEAWMPWPRLLIRAALSFSWAGLVMILVGVFGVLSYSIAQLTREFGIRVALGASPSSIARQVLGRGLHWAIVGVGMGGVATLIIHELVRSRIWGLAPLDLNLIAAVAGLVLTAAGVTSWLPARRAMRVNPVTVLREE